MSLKSKLSSVFTLAFAIAAFGVVISAQETTPAPKDDTQKIERRGMGRHGGERGFRGEHRGGRGMRGGMFGLRGIELTDAQKEQIRQIHEANKPNEALMAELKSIHEARKEGTALTDAQKERIKSIRSEMKTKRESVHQQVLAILTPEQRQQIETRKAEMEKRREEMKLRRQELRQKRDDAKPAVKPTDNN
jgi:Spy/CpxP family protein refolding chaperone